MKRVFAAILLAMLLLPSVRGAEFPSWNDWKFSNDEYVEMVGNEIHLRFSNDSFEMSGVFDNLEKGARISFAVNYSVSRLAVYAGMRILVNGEAVEERKLTGDGTVDERITVAEERVEISIIFFVVQGSISVAMREGRIILSERGIESGLIISGVGITTVFIVLGILSGIMYGLGALEIERREEGKKEEKIEEGEDMKPTPDEIVAIMAAIEQYMKGKKVRIISVKPSPWKFYGRLMNMRRLR